MALFVVVSCVYICLVIYLMLYQLRVMLFIVNLPMISSSSSSLYVSHMFVTRVLLSLVFRVVLL